MVGDAADHDGRRPETPDDSTDVGMDISNDFVREIRVPILGAEHVVVVQAVVRTWHAIMLLWGVRKMSATRWVGKIGAIQGSQSDTLATVQRPSGSRDSRHRSEPNATK